MQVQAAIKESQGGISRTGSGAPHALQSAISGTPKALQSSSRLSNGENGQLSSSASANGSATPVMPEGTETALLYVRFRAVAEPGLKGASTLLVYAPIN